METNTMGQVQVVAKLENLQDLYDAKRGRIPPDQIRTVEVPDALVDTGATMLGVTKSLIEALGISQYTTHRVRTTNGVVERAIFEAVRLTIQGRDCTIDVAEVPEDCPVLIGQVPLELLDFVVDPAARRLIGNPQHGGNFMFDQF